MKNENNSMILESLSRLWKHMDNGEPIAFISASRANLPPDENKERHGELKSAVKRASFGYNEVVGSYRENGQEKATKEMSLAIFAKPEEEQKLKDLVMALGKKYEQDSVMFRYCDGRVVYISTSNGSSIGAIGKELKMGNKINTHKIESYYSKIGNKEFVIESSTEEHEPSYGSYNGRVIAEKWNQFVEKYGANALEEWDKATNKD